MTINEAARKSLQILGIPSKLDNILEVIIENGFYSFGAKDPKGALSAQLIRSSKGFNAAVSSKEKIFYKAGPATFGLLAWLSDNDVEQLEMEEEILSFQECYSPDASKLDTSLFLEKEWHQWLFKNLEENGLIGLGFGHCTLFDREKQKNVMGKYDTKEVGEIDLLLKSAKGDIIVIELKRKGTDETVGQVCRYVGWVEENLAVNKQTSVYGMIIAQHIDKRLMYAIRPIKDHIFYQQLMFNVEFGESSKKHSETAPVER
ncbi:endonuclease NucS domain-containing protein [Geomonas azotofigens]|uniref:endonuclease NucS domain-containing protein n=1 Tax=Geomonas azotofigens TaxID=2843196 RepID=UPI001C1159EB|nr:endonuclease NucS domain-containing protein [Geomonas azotofigens]MBU5612635.1 DUF1016 family protein [Geomonas azotofigens]